MSDVEVAWLTGVFEGEGCISTDGRRGRWRLQVQMCDVDIIERLHSLTGVGTVRHPSYASRPSHWTPIHRWTVHGRDAIALLRIMLPLLGHRRRARAAEAIADWEAHEHTWHPSHPARVARRRRDPRSKRDEIAALLAEGLSVHEIARRLDIDRTTVRYWRDSTVA